MSSEGCGSLGRDSSPRSRAHVSADCAEVQPRVCDWISEGEERDLDRARIQRGDARLRWKALLGAGYFVSTVGRDEETIRKYIRHQESEDRRTDQLGML